MKSTLDTLEGLSRKINIEVPVEKVNDAFTRVYKGIQKNANIKGFRKGKAPISTIKSLYADKVKSDVLQDLVSESYQKALQEHSLDPISQPHININAFSENESFAFSAQLEIRPEVNLNTYEGLEVEKETINIDESKIDEVINNIKNSFKENVPVFEDRSAQEGDVADINFDGYVDNEPLPGGKADNHLLELGSNSFIPGFEEQVVGMKVNSEKEIHLSFPEDYHAKEIAGKPVVFKVKLNKLMKQVLPELNDDLVKKLGDKFNTVDELKEAIREDLKLNEEKRIHDDLKNRILRALTEANPVEVPASLKSEQKQRLVDDVVRRLKQQGMDDAAIADYNSKWDAEYEKNSAFMIQSSFLVDALATKLELRATQKDVDNKIAQQAAESGLEVERLKEYFDKPEQQSNLRYQCTEENVVNFLIEKAQVTEVDKDKLSDKEEVL